MCETQWTMTVNTGNPREWQRKHLVQEFSRRDPATRAYIEALLPRIWARVEDMPLDRVGEALGLSPDEEARILADMALFVVPRLTKPRQPLVFPERVPHETRIVSMDRGAS